MLRKIPQQQKQQMDVMKSAKKGKEDHYLNICLNGLWIQILKLLYLSEAQCPFDSCYHYRTSKDEICK